MNEGNRSKAVESLQDFAASRRKLVMAIGGTVAALPVAGLLWQALSTPEAETAQSPGDGKQPKPSDARRAANARGYLARVNKQLITWDEVADECMARYANDVLENIINRVIIQQACTSQGITVTATEVDHEILTISKRFKVPVEEWYNLLENERDLKPAQYRRDIIWPMLALRKLAGADVTITQKMLAEAFQRDYGPRVKAKMIMFDNLRRAQGIYSKIRQNPDDFERLAREHSIEPNSRALDGAVPPIRMYGGNLQLEKAAFKLKKEGGEISGITEIGPSRYVILLGEGRTEPVVKNIDEVRDELLKQLKEEETQKKIARVFDKIKQQTRVDTYISGRSSGNIRPVSGTKPNFDANAVTPAAGTARTSSRLRTAPPEQLPPGTAVDSVLPRP